ncbi:hypothetical protein VNO80_10067 [Phaseolus coccineus]|uniref:Uncharacterized protein n=1 Tax=Phaseolus coccineus TaxID=3886 RepID=A0AAN9RA53_PHACN
MHSRDKVADFLPVDFLHRVGCTVRAGQIGLVTNMYTESNRELVDAVRWAEERGQPMQDKKLPQQDQEEG